MRMAVKKVLKSLGEPERSRVVGPSLEEGKNYSNRELAPSEDIRNFECIVYTSETLNV